MHRKFNARLASYALFSVLCAATVEAQFTVSGTVTDPAAAPVAGVQLLLFDTNQNPIGILPTVTNAAGFYSIGNFPAGNFVLRFVPAASTGLLFQESTITVAGNMTVNVSLAAGHIISGFVRNTLGVGIPLIDLNVTDKNTGELVETPGDNTDITGFYDIVLATGEYDIIYRPVSGEPLITVELPTLTITADTTINVTMLPAITLSGFVRGPGGAPVFNADLDAVDVATGLKLDTPNDNSDILGFYSIILPPGVYDIDVEPLLVDRLVPEEVQNVTVTVNTTLNFQLEAGVLDSGVVTGPFAQIVANVDIDMEREITGEDIFLSPDQTNIAGIFAFISPLGTFTVDFQPPLLTKLAPVRFTGVTFVNDTSFNISLIAGLSVTGLITNSTAVPVIDVDIDAKDPVTGIGVPLLGDFTDAAGLFGTVIAPGTYNFEIEPPFARRLVPVILPSLTLSIDTALSVSLDTGMLVSGIVRDSLGLVLLGVRATVIASSTTDTVFLPRSKTDNFGAYAFLVAPGTYDLLFKPDSTLGLTDTVLFTNVVITKDTVINLTLAGAAVPVFTISGTVIELGASPLANVEVSLLTGGGAPIQVPATVTDALGQYAINNVIAGTYNVRFDPPAPPTVFARLVTGVTVSDNVVLNVALETCDASCGCCDVAGDANHSGAVNIADVTFLISRIFAFGPPPFCNDEADANGSSSVNIADITFLISRIFAAGLPPVCGTTGT
ncbi:MAG: carboxypeptidase regulatory-like domain-containing protein [candidate division Zixibacteria bacterium]|nr:carboxypeptidase regulatory-like domain-containing protein [candidate division Zixibacteria bacterium]